MELSYDAGNHAFPAGPAARGLGAGEYTQTSAAPSGKAGQAAVAGHLAIYALMVIVPAVRLLVAAGSKGGLSYLGIQIFPPRETEVAWLQVAVEWHGEMGWFLSLLILGHIAMAVVWHRLIRRDEVLGRMA